LSVSNVANFVLKKLI